MPVREVYFDNAATSFPKPPCVAEAMASYAQTLGAPARGAHARAREVKRLIDDCRAAIAQFVNAPSPDHVVFTLNTTDAMNLAIHGVVGRALRERPADRPVHVVTSDLDHNSALRPINELVVRSAGRVTQTRVPLDPHTGVLAPAAFERAITADTVLVATLHASNVTGIVQPLTPIGAMCRRRGVLFLVDAAQSLGHVPVDCAAMHADLLAFPGHKGLLGPTGTGGLVIRPGVEDRLDTVRQGGTGWRSELESMPQHLPDRFEPGSHNAVGLIGLGAAVRWLIQHQSEVFAHEATLARRMLEGLTGRAAPRGLTLLGPHDAATPRVGVFSFVHDAIAPAQLADRLERDFGILGRFGLHCAPRAHATMGSGGSASGAMRLSIGPFTTHAEVDAALAALRRIGDEAAGATGVQTPAAARVFARP